MILYYCYLCWSIIHFEWGVWELAFCHFSTTRKGILALKHGTYQNTQFLIVNIPMEPKYLENYYKLLGEHLRFLWKWNHVLVTELPAVLQSSIYLPIFLSVEFLEPYIMMFSITWRFLITMSGKSATLQKCFVRIKQLPGYN